MKIYDKISFLNFSFIMIHIIYNILVLIKNHMNYFQDNILERLFSEKLIFSTANNNENVLEKKIKRDFQTKKEIKGIEYVILRYTKNLVEHEEEKNYSKLVRINVFQETNILDIKLMVMQIKDNQLKNILIKLDHI